MELIIMLANQIVGMVMMVFAGFIVAKLGIVTAEDNRALSRICIYVAVPCALVDGFQTDFDVEKLVGMAIVAAAAAVIFAVFLVLGKMMEIKGFTPGERASAIYGNSGNLIMPLVQNTLGSGYLIYTCAFQLVQNALVWTHATNLMSGEKTFSLRKGLLNSNMISIYIGLTMFLLHIRLPDALAGGVHTMGTMVGPLAMLVVGIILAGMDLKSALRSLRVYRIVALRLLVFPCVALLLLLPVAVFWKGSDTVNVLTVALLCASGPAASLVPQFAQLYDRPEKEHVSFINAVSTILCALTIPSICGIFRFFTL